MPARNKCSVDAEWMSWGSTQVRGSWRVPRWPVALQPPGLAPLLLCAPCLAVEEGVRADPKRWTRILRGEGGEGGGEGRLSGPDRPVMGGGAAQNGHSDCSRSHHSHPRSPPHGPVYSHARLALIHTWWAFAMDIDSFLAFDSAGASTIRQTPSSGI